VQRTKINPKEKLSRIATRYLEDIKDNQPHMEVAPFLEKWVPRFFPGIQLYSRTRKNLIFLFPEETQVEVTYKEACVKLLNCWYPSITKKTLEYWKGDITGCPDTYKVALKGIDAVLEFWMVVKNLTPSTVSETEERQQSEQRVA
jgi:hypothetical protein